MKKILFFFLAMTMVFILAPINSACGTEYQLIGRELSPGILQPSDAPPGEGVYNGALFIGKIFGGGPTSLGYFTVVLDRVNEGVEICEATTDIIEFKLVMNFKNGSRLVLVMVDDGYEASWNYDDPGCADGCVFPGYGDYLFLLGPNPEGFLCDCDDSIYGGDTNVSLIAKVPSIVLTKKWFGSWGSLARGVSGAELSGWLVHTPLLIPAVFGTVSFYEPD